MRRLYRTRQVEIFNFSFLDVLACTIGLLIFIMVMVFILQSGSAVADTGAIIGKKLRDASMLQASAARDAQIAQGLEAQLDQLRAPNMPDLTPQRDAARLARDAARANYDASVRQVEADQGRLDENRLSVNFKAVPFRILATFCGRGVPSAGGDGKTSSSVSSITGGAVASSPPNCDGLLLG